MRKSFTRLLSIVMLIGMIFLQAVAMGAVPTVVGGDGVPGIGESNYDGRTGELVVTLTFDQSVQPGTAHVGIIGLRTAGAQVDPIQISGTTSTNPVTGSTVVINDKVVTITFYRTLSEGDTYYITASADALMNASGQYWAGYADGVYDITIGDYTAPEIDVVATVPQFFPESGDNEFPKDGVLTATFDEGVMFNAGPNDPPTYIGIYTEDGNVVELFDVTDPAVAGDFDNAPALGQVSIDMSGNVDAGKNVLYIRPSNDLVELQKYYVRIESAGTASDAAITDDSPNANEYAGINNNTTWNFQVADETAPTVTFAPVTTTPDVQQEATLVMTFKDNRTAAGLSFSLVETATGDALTVGDDVGPSGLDIIFFEEGGAPFTDYTAEYTAINEITITLDADALATLEDYEWGIAAGSVEDEEGNVMAETTATFVSGDFTPATMTVVAAEAGGTGAAPNNDADDLETVKLYMEVDISNEVDGVTGSDYPVELHYLIVANNAPTPTPDQVLAGPILPVDEDTPADTKHLGWAVVDKDGAPLQSATEYDIYFAAIDNATIPNKSTQAQVTASKQDNVKTNDIEAPVVESVEMDDMDGDAQTLTEGGSVTEIAYTSDITITFDEDIIASVDETNFTIVYDDGTTNGYTLANDGSEYTVTVVGDVITIAGLHPDADADAAGVTASWQSKGKYTLTFNDEEITDDVSAAGNTGTDNPVTEKTYTFTTVDYIGPIPLFTSNDTDVDNAVATSDNIVIDLGEACTRADGSAITASNVFFRDALSAIVPATITISGGRTITIDPTNPLDDDGANYTVEITSTIKDAAGNTLGYYEDGTVIAAGVTGSVEFLEISTLDETDPVVTFTPADGTTNLDKDDLTSVGGNVTVDVTISEAVFTASGDEINLAGDFNFLRQNVTFVRNSDNKSYMVDFSGNTATSFTIVPMEDDGTSPVTELLPGESYTVTVNGLYDAADNLITDNSTTFTIREYTVPFIISSGLSPADNAIKVSATADLVITWSEPITANAGNITITNTGGGDGWVADDWVAGDVETFDVTADVVISGNTLTIPNAAVTNFIELGEYSVTFPAGIVKDAVGNVSTVAYTLATTWNFTAFDNTLPVIANQTTDVVPNDGATTATVPTEIEITFTEASGKIEAGAGKIYIREVGNTGIPDFTFNAQGPEVHITGTVVTIDLNSSVFNYGGDYWVEIDANAFKDPSGNYFAGYVADETKWNFTINADPDPEYVVASSTPADGANDVDLNSDFIIKFSEPVVINTATTPRKLTIFDSANAAHFIVDFAGASTQWQWNATHDELTILNVSTLVEDEDYYIEIDDNTFKAQTGGAAMAFELNDPADWSFTTTDNTDPEIATIAINGVSIATAVNPDPVIAAADKGKNIIITFDEPVDIAAGDLNSCVVLSSGTFVGSFSDATNTLTINPDVDFASEAVVTVTTVANKIFDEATVPNDVAGGAVVASFKLIDYVTPLWDDNTVADTPGNNEVTFDVSVNEDDCTIYVWAVDAGTLTATPAPATVKANATHTFAVDDADTDVTVDDLLGDHEYDFYFIAEDDVPNLMDGTTVNQEVLVAASVSTLDNVAPLLRTTYNTSPYTAGLSPADGATCVDPATTLKLKFNETVVVNAAANVWVRKVADNNKVTIASVTAAADVVTITLAAPLADATDYYVEINYDAIRDANANPWEEIFYGPTRWNFKTADATAPTIANFATDLTPFNGETDVTVVAAGNPLVMEFDENVVKDDSGLLFIEIYRDGAASPHEIINVSGSGVQVVDNVVTITRLNTYASEKDYYVVVPAGAFVDESCDPNDFGGIAAHAWQFTTADVSAPRVDFDPDGLAVVNSATTPSVDLTFYDLVQATYEDLYDADGVAIPNATDLKDQITVTDKDGAVALTSAIYTTTGAGDGKITVLVTGGLTSNNTYTVTYTADADITDDKGNVVPTSSVEFDTDDRTSPTVEIVALLTNPSTPEEVKVETTFRMTFNKQILNNKVGGTDNLAPSKAEMEVVGDYFTFKKDPTGANTDVDYTITVVTPGLVYDIVPDDDLDSEAEYEIAFVATTGVGGSGIEIQDDLYLATNANNIMDIDVADMTFDFVAEDVVDPSMVAPFVPADGGTPATLTADLVITFDEAVQAGTGTIQIRYANGQIFDEIPVADCDFTDAATAPFEVSIPHDAFAAFMGYYVVIPSGTFVDVSYNENPYAGFLNNTSWNFSTDDGTDPSVLIYSPEQNDVDIAVNANLVLTFDENIVMNAGNLVIYFNNGDAGANGNAMEIIPFNSTKITVSGTNPVDANHVSDKVTINPSMEFDFNAPGEYYVRIDEGWVRDNAGNLYGGINDNITWRFGITDPTIPTLDVTLLNPAQDQPDVPQVLTGVSMTFDRNVLKGAGYIDLYQYYYDPATFMTTEKRVERISVDDVNIENATVTFDLQTRLLDDMTYYFLADNGSFTNTASSLDWWGGITDPFVWRFTTIQDVIAPTLESKTMEGATCVDPDAVTLSMTFDEGVQAGAGSLNVINAADDVVAATVPASDATYSNGVATFTVPADLLADKTEYYVTLDMNAISDTARVVNYWDSSVIAAGDWTFYTGDFTAPTLDEFTPITGTDNLGNSVTLELTFSEDVQPGYEPLVVTKVSDATEVYNSVITEEQIAANVVSIDLAGLEDGETYAVTFASGLVQDLAYTSNEVECGNLNASAALGTTWEFTIDDNAAPEIVSTLPDGTNELSGVTIEITLSEAVTAVAGKLVTITAAEQTPIEVLVSDMLTTDNLVFTTDLTGLADNTTYTVTVASGSFIDGAVIPNATEAISWEFTTGDNTAPAIVVDGLTPTGTLPSYIGVELTMTFDEAVVKGTGDITIGSMVIPVSSENVTISEDGTVVTIVPTSNLTFTSYVVTVAEGAFMDANDNVSPLTTWSFTIADNAFDASCMSADHFKPFDNSINQEADIDLEITFCEKVIPGTGKVKVFQMVTASNTLFRDYEISEDMISEDGLTVTIPVTGLFDNTSYGVLIEAGAVKDEAGNNYLGISDPTFWNFTTGDNTAPTLLITSDQTDLTNATNDVVLTLTFDEPVYGVAAGVSATADGVSVTPEVLTGVDGDKVYTVKVTAADMAEVVVTVAQTITDGIVVLNENALDQVYTYTYTVGDYTAPELVSAVATAAPIPTSFEVVLTFNEPMDSKIENPFTITGGAITDAVVNDAQTEITLSITAAEEAEVVLVLTDQLIDQSVNENALVPVTLTYTVGDFTAPTVTPDIASGTTNMEATFDVVLTFSADAIVTDADITVAAATSYTVDVVGNVATVTITAEDMTVVTVTAASTIADEAGLLLDGPRVFTYKTGDNTAPELITVNPNGLATANAHPAKLELFFVENVVVGTGNLTIYRADGTEELVVPASDVTITNKTVTVTMTASLDKNTEYYVLVDEGFVTDANGNAFVGIASTTYWTFTTGDFATGNNPIVGDSLELKVYPNPFAEYIKVDSNAKLSRIVITSITGQKVKEVVNPTQMIQTNELRSGVYLISLYVDDVIAKTERIVKR